MEYAFLLYFIQQSIRFLNKIIQEKKSADTTVQTKYSKVSLLITYCGFLFCHGDVIETYRLKIYIRSKIPSTYLGNIIGIRSYKTVNGF